MKTGIFMVSLRYQMSSRYLYLTLFGPSSRGPLTEMSDKCRRYVADPNIECFRASRCDAIVYREKIFRLYRCRCNGVVRKILNLSVIYRLVWFAYYIRDLTLDGGLNCLFYAETGE